MTSDITYSAAQKLVTREVEDDVVIFNLSDRQMYGLKAVAAELWRFLQEPRTLNQLEQYVTREFAVEPERARQDVTRLLEDLQAKKLIVVTSELPAV